MFEEEQQEQLCFTEDGSHFQMCIIYRHRWENVLISHLAFLFFFPPCSAADQFIANSEV